MCNAYFGSARTIGIFAIVVYFYCGMDAFAVEVNTHIHKSGIFSITASSPQIHETDSTVQFTHTMPFVGISGWDAVSFVMPESSQGGTDEVMKRSVGEIAEDAYKSIKRKKNRPSASVLEETANKASGREVYYARVLYPRLPGTGVRVLNQEGKWDDPDYIAYLHLISIEDVGVYTRNLQDRYLLVSSFRVKSLAPENDNSHLAFLDSLKLLDAPDFIRGRYAGQYGFDVSIPATHVAYGPVFPDEGISSETLFIFPDGTPLENIADEQLFESSDIIRLEAMRRDHTDFKITLDGTRTIFEKALQQRGETFNFVDLDLSRPAFKVTITEPLHLVQVCIEAENLLFVISAGQDDDVLGQIIDSVNETDGARLE